MIPDDYVHLNYPQEFEPPKRGQKDLAHRSDLHSYDALLNHAVFDSERFSEFMKSDPYTVTTLRNPVSRLRSGMQFYQNEHMDPAFFEAVTSSDWGFLNRDALHCQGASGNACANGQAFDLGWFSSPEHEQAAQKLERTDAQSAPEHFCNTLEFQSWMDRISRELQFVAILEHFDESLVLLGQAYGLALPELLYIPKKVVFRDRDIKQSLGKPQLAQPWRGSDSPVIHVATDLKLPAGEMKQRAEEINLCDEKLHAFYNESLWQRWHEASSETNAFLRPRHTPAQDLANFRRMNKEIYDYCAEETNEEKELCKILLMDSWDFTKWYAITMDCNGPSGCEIETPMADANSMICDVIDCTYHGWLS
jgi:hypothetical protein